MSHVTRIKHESGRLRTAIRKTAAKLEIYSIVSMRCFLLFCNNSSQINLTSAVHNYNTTRDAALMNRST